MSDTPLYDGLSAADTADEPAVVDFTDLPILNLDEFPDAGPTYADQNGDQAGGQPL